MLQKAKVWQKIDRYHLLIGAVALISILVNIFYLSPLKDIELPEISFEKYDKVELTIKQGDTLYSLFSELGLTPAQILQITNVLDTVKSSEALKVGEVIAVYFPRTLNDEVTEQFQPAKIEFLSDLQKIVLTAEGSYTMQL